MKSLEGVHTLLSFVAEQGDINSPIQKALIDAAVGAGVRRFAPCEWSTYFSLFPINPLFTLFKLTRRKVPD